MSNKNTLLYLRALVPALIIWELYAIEDKSLKLMKVPNLYKFGRALYHYFRTNTIKVYRLLKALETFFRMGPIPLYKLQPFRSYKPKKMNVSAMTKKQFFSYSEKELYRHFWIDLDEIYELLQAF